jgi:hypothetical protein
MTGFLKYLIVFLVIVGQVSCKRSTDIKISAFNYALNEPIADANVVIIERKQGGIFSPSYSCKEIANATTDSNGECLFSRERLKTRNAYEYFVVINYAYGRSQSYPCGGKTSGYLTVGKTSEQFIHYETYDAYFQVQYNNLLNPAQPGDSLAIGIGSPLYSIPGEPYPFGGGGVYGTAFSTNSINYPFPSSLTTGVVTTNAGKQVVHSYKKKLGVVTLTYDTVKIMPYETKIITINW